MNLVESISEVGPLTLLVELSKVGGNLGLLREPITRALPVMLKSGNQSEEIIRTNLRDTLKNILGYSHKRRLMLVGAELLLLEVLAEMALDLEILVLLDHILPRETVLRIFLNIPANLNVQVIQAPEVPFGIKPSDSVMVAVGFEAGCGMALMLESTRSLLNFYSSVYFGEIVMLDPLQFTVLSRPEGWVTVTKSQVFTQYVLPMLQGKAR